MNILIQHNFSSGLGDFLIAMSEYMTYCKKLKDIGYKINLYVNLQNNKYINFPSKFMNKIFDQETLSFFDEIIEDYSGINHNNNYKEYRYWKSAHEPQFSGVHRWDIFIENKEPPYLQYPVLSTLHLLLTQIINENNIVYPKFNRDIENKARIFLQQFGIYNFLQVRVEDGKDCIANKDFIDKIQQLINNNEIFHIGTNSKSIFDIFQSHPKTLFYPFRQFETIGNHHNVGHRVNRIFNNDMLEERFLDTVIEMVSIKHANKIYHYSDYTWPSSFLFYGSLVSKKRPIDVKIEI